jgi:hypothetical protein
MAGMEASIGLTRMIGYLVIGRSSGWGMFGEYLGDDGSTPPAMRSREEPIDTLDQADRIDRQRVGVLAELAARRRQAEHGRFAHHRNIQAIVAVKAMEAFPDPLKSRSDHFSAAPKKRYHPPRRDRRTA